ncbi:MAG: DUF1501 domain-containing protein [Planctomycetota bacterium]|nr:DUF1501 domain-containing protein [Planctomycetota bacterium]
MNTPLRNMPRRTLIRSMGGGSLLFPGILSELLAVDASPGSDGPLAPKPPHFAPKAKRVIFLFATGGVSHIDTFDPKPSDKWRDGSGKDKLMGSVVPYSANKRCGTEVSDLFPHLREQMDDICVIPGAQPMAALIKDLKQRNMLDETLIVWATEFGRTPTKEGKNGRGHHGDCFSIWLAGGGIKGGIVHGETDDIGKAIARDKVDVHDLHVTILHQMGIDHTKLTYRHAGRDFRLTDVYGKIIRDILVIS